MNKKLLGLCIIVSGVMILGVMYMLETNKSIISELPDQDEPDKTSREIHKEIEKSEKPPEETVQKTYTNPYNNFTINYEVGVENGVEESPPPNVLVAITNSFTEEQREQFKQDYYNSDFFKQRHQYDEMRKKHNVLYIKQYIDEGFTCDTYKDLAYKYKSTYMFDEDGNWVDAENYVYKRAFNECIDPKYQEELEKVQKELEEVNKPN